ncbi:MAG: type II toxin-antitoxin system RelE/ParE family toxin [Candidatus Rokubacteria bacterium]|nr:type II toxin-antitoxin system RelE/ParE family toxin [Candidatus Rokubacteria bacterium]
MASYRLLIKPSAAKELEGIPLKDRQRLVKRIQALADEPRLPGCEKLSGSDRYRIRQGNYRVVFGIEDDQLVVVVVKAGHRRDVYR